MNRRHVLQNVLHTSVYAGVLAAVPGALPRVAAADELIRSRAFPPADGAYHLGTLHAGVALNPAFAYFAALPGPFSDAPATLRAWREFAVADHWQALLDETGLVSVATHIDAPPPMLVVRQLPVAASCFSGRRFGCEGLSATVAAALGAVAVAPDAQDADYRETIAGPTGDRPDGAVRLAPILTRMGSPVMLTVTRATWRWLGSRGQGNLTATFARQPSLNSRDDRQKLVHTPRSVITAADRVSAAIVADTAHANRLTRKLNSSYFQDLRRAS